MAIGVCASASSRATHCHLRTNTKNTHRDSQRKRYKRNRRRFECVTAAVGAVNCNLTFTFLLTATQYAPAHEQINCYHPNETEEWKCLGSFAIESLRLLLEPNHSYFIITIDVLCCGSLMYPSIRQSALHAPNRKLQHGNDIASTFTPFKWAAWR